MGHKQKIAIIITCILVMSALSAYADMIRPMYVAISGFSCSLSISSGTASCSAKITPAKSGYTPSLIVTLRRSTDGVSWSYVDSWSTTGSGIFGASISETKTVSGGYQYKLFATGTIKDSNGAVIEQANKNSSVKKY